jgi:hypothetical protein
MAFAREVTVTYNLFRSDDLDELYCAVPEHRAVPRFVKAGAWSFEGKIREEGAPKAFDGSAAKVGVRFNGFHLFQGLRFRLARRNGRRQRLLSSPCRRSAAPSGGSRTGLRGRPTPVC